MQVSPLFSFVRRDAPLRAASIDIGSNTFRLLAATISENGLTISVKKLATVRLAEKLAANGILAPDAMERAFTVLRGFREILDNLQSERVRVCGTAALRTAANSGEFLRRAQEILQAEIEIISGEEEALLSLTGAVAFLKEGLPGPFLLVDVGGGSTELILAAGPFASGSGGPADKPWIASLPLGAVSLTEEFFGRGVPTGREIDRLTRRIEEVLTPALETVHSAARSGFPQVLGTGGTATSLAALDLGMEAYDETRVQGYLLPKKNLERIWERLVDLSAADRNRLPGLEHGRGEIIPAGLRIYQLLLELLGSDTLMVSDAGLLEGILLSNVRGG